MSIYTILGQFHCPKNPLDPSCSLLSPPNPWQLLIFPTTFIVLPFPECHVVGIIQCVVFSDWLLSLSTIYLRPLYISSRLESSFLFVLNNIPLPGILPIQSPMKGHLGCLQVLAIMNKLLYTFVCRFLCGLKFSIPLGEYQGTQFLDYMIQVHLVS